jgi:hypothetical protein
MSQEIQAKPDFYRLPLKGGDAHFGLTRSWYYAREKAGDIRLVHVRARGKLRGCTLVPYDIVAAFIRAQAGAEINGTGGGA